MKFITPIALIVAALALFFFYVKPQYVQIQKLQAQEDQYNSALDEANQAGTKLAGLVTNYNALSADDLNRLQEFLPDNVDAVTFAVDASNILSRYGVPLQNIKISAPATTAPSQNTSYNTLSLSFGTSLPYSQFVELLSGIEKNLRFMDISSINFTAPVSEPYTYTVGLKTYWLK